MSKKKKVVLTIISILVIITILAYPVFGVFTFEGKYVVQDDHITFLHTTTSMLGLFNSSETDNQYNLTGQGFVISIHRFCPKTDPDGTRQVWETFPIYQGASVPMTFLKIRGYWTPLGMYYSDGKGLSFFNYYDDSACVTLLDEDMATP